MPDERREFHKIRPASHTLLSVNCLYQMNMEKRKGVFTKLGRRLLSGAWRIYERSIKITYLGGGRRHTIVTSSATAIPSDTSTKRCEATTQGGRPWAISRTMVSVMAAKR
jgi:predicted metal-dependent RNase